MTTCRDCPISLLCLAGRIPKEWVCHFVCKRCGKSRWIEHRRPYAKQNRDREHALRCAFIPEKAEKVSICQSCYIKREAAVDKDPGNWAPLPRQGRGMWGQ